MRIDNIYINFETDQTALEPSIIGANISFRAISAVYGDVSGILKVTPSDLRALLDQKTTKEALAEKYIKEVLALDTVELDAHDVEEARRQDAKRDERIQALESQNLEMALALSQTGGAI